MNNDQLIKIAKYIGLGTLIMCSVTVCILLCNNTGNKQTTINVFANNSAPETTQYSSISYNRNLFSYTSNPNNNTDSESMSEDIYDFPVIYDSPTECVINESYTSTSKIANETIYALCKEYFECQDVTFLMPMIIANNESAIRADKDVTFSAIFPSKVFPIENAGTIINFNCTRCLESSSIFSVMGADWWTRDRGPVQMNPDYGVHDDKYNKMMGKSEHAQLSKIKVNNDLTAYTNKDGIIDAQYWYEKSSTNAGDRFNIQDICLRLSSEYNYALNTMSSTYECDEPLLKMVMLSMYHGAGSLWMPAYVDTQIGYWNSGRVAYEYALALSSNEVYEVIFSKAKNDILNARRANSNPEVGISVNRAFEIYQELFNSGYIKDVNYYTSQGDYRTDYLVYPIKAIYNYAQLSILYSGG